MVNGWYLCRSLFGTNVSSVHVTCVKSKSALRLAPVVSSSGLFRGLTSLSRREWNRIGGSALCLSVTHPPTHTHTRTRPCCVDL